MATLSNRAVRTAAGAIAAGAFLGIFSLTSANAAPVSVSFETELLQKASSNIPATQLLPVDLEGSGVSFSGYVARLNGGNSPTGFTNSGFSVLFAGADGTITRVQNGQNTFRFVYSQDSLVSPDTSFFQKNLLSTFDSFYLNGTCAVCGIDAQITSQASAALGTFTGPNAAAPVSGSYTIDSALIPFSYGTTGFTGTLQYSAFNSFVSGSTVTDSSASFTLTAVPGPLPVAGVAFAFGWSRKLRRRIAASRTI